MRVFIVGWKRSGEDGFSAREFRGFSRSFGRWHLSTRWGAFLYATKPEAKREGGHGEHLTGSSGSFFLSSVQRICDFALFAFFAVE
jgi:hypothetical protein